MVISTENVFEVLDIVDDGENRWCHVVFKQDGVDYVGYINADYVLYVDGGEILDDPTQEVPTPAEPSPYPTDIPQVVDPADFEALLDAKELGSDYIVVGRPITQAADPVAAYRRCVSEFV